MIKQRGNRGNQALRKKCNACYFQNEETEKSQKLPMNYIN